MAITTDCHGIRPLFDALDEAHIPYASGGGTLLLGDPLLQAAGVADGRHLRSALLFTADGSWYDA